MNVLLLSVACALHYLPCSSCAACASELCVKCHVRWHDMHESSVLLAWECIPAATLDVRNIHTYIHTYVRMLVANNCCEGSFWYQLILFGLWLSKVAVAGTVCPRLPSAR
jgi:hypothetical protein